jgi:hypothetical protein
MREHSRFVDREDTRGDETTLTETSKGAASLMVDTTDAEVAWLGESPLVAPQRRRAPTRTKRAGALAILRTTSVR